MCNVVTRFSTKGRALLLGFGCQTFCQNESLCFQVVSLQEKVNKLEQDKEHWMLESQLVQVKLDKEKQVTTGTKPDQQN